MDYHIIVISEMHRNASRNVVKGRRPQNIVSFVVTQTILLLGVAETFDMSSRGCSTIKVENSCSNTTRVQSPWPRCI